MLLNMQICTLQIKILYTRKIVHVHIYYMSIVHVLLLYINYKTFFFDNLH